MREKNFGKLRASQHSEKLNTKPQMANNELVGVPIECFALAKSPNLFVGHFHFSKKVSHRDLNAIIHTSERFDMIYISGHSGVEL